jgi:hypothetical protein
MTRKPFLPAEQAIGSVVMLGDQRYTLIGTQSFRRRDGSAGLMLRWRSACPDYGCEFLTASMLGSPTRRCRAHRQARRTVGAHRKRLSVRFLHPGAAS